MRKMSLGLAVLAAMLASAGFAEAAEKCSPQALAGVHILRTNTPSVCVLELNSKGTITESRCYDPDFETELGTLEGKLSVAPSCRMTGTVAQILLFGETRVVFAIEARGALVDGLLEVQGTAKNPNEKLKIEAAQQW